MSCIWRIYGVYIACIWRIYGVYMAYIKRKYTILNFNKDQIKYTSL